MYWIYPDILNPAIPDILKRIKWNIVLGKFEEPDKTSGLVLIIRLLITVRMVINYNYYSSTALVGNIVEKSMWFGYFREKICLGKCLKAKMRI